MKKSRLNIQWVCTRVKVPWTLIIGGLICGLVENFPNGIRELIHHIVILIAYQDNANPLIFKILSNYDRNYN